MGVTRESVVSTAAGWVGMLERTGSNDIWFADDWGITGSAWCFAYTQSGFYYAPRSPDGKLPHESMYCPYGIAWARENNQAIEVGGAGPQPGDIVFFSWDMVEWPRWRAGTGDHVGIVEAWDGGDLVWTLEGNIGNPQGVYRKVRSISESVVCFWRPTVFDDSGLIPATIQEDDMFQDPDRGVLNGVSSTVTGLSDAVRELLRRVDRADTLATRIYHAAGGDRLMVDPSKIDPTRDFHPGWGSEDDVPRYCVNDDALLRALTAVAPGQPTQPGQPGPPAPVNVSAVLAQASPEQLAEVGTGKLFAALGLAMQVQQARPPVTPPG